MKAQCLRNGLEACPARRQGNVVRETQVQVDEATLEILSTSVPSLQASHELRIVGAEMKDWAVLG